MRVREFMSRDVETVGEDVAAEAAVARMRSRRIRHLVVMRAGSVAGVVSERDLGGRRASSAALGRTVADVMTRHAVTIGSDATVREAARLLRGRNIGCLPVTEGGSLVGIVTTSDLLELLGRGAEKVVPTAERRLLRQRGPRRRAGIRYGA